MKTYKEFKQDISIDERYDKDLDADGNGKLTKRDFALLRKKKKKTDCMEAAEKPSSQYTTTSKGTFKTKNDRFYPEYDKHEQGKTSDAKKKKYAELGLKCDESEELEEVLDTSKATNSYLIKSLEKRKGLIAKNKPFNAEIQRKINKSFAGSHKAIDKTNIAPLGKVKEDFEELDEARFKKGEDIGKPNTGKNTGFKNLANKAAKEYGSKEAGAVLNKILTKEDLELALEMALSEEIEYKNPDDKLKHIHITRDKVTGKVTNINHTVSGKDGRNYDTDVDVNDNTLDKHLKDIKSAVGKTRISINGSRGEPIRIGSDNVDQHIKDIKDAHSGKKGLEQFSPAKTLPKGSVQRPIGDRDRHSGM